MSVHHSGTSRAAPSPLRITLSASCYAYLLRYGAKTTEPDILDDLDEMWPILAGAEGGRIYQPGEIAAVMLLAAGKIRRLRETCRVFQKAISNLTHQRCVERSKRL
jgi:hypothetical protein